MKRIGKIETTNSIVYKQYEVIQLTQGMYAGKDAFYWPNNKEDLRSMSSIVIPGEWRWIEKYSDAEPEREMPPKGKAKYTVIRGEEAHARIIDLLKRYETGTLILNGLEYPYAIPINHAYKDGNLYMHCGKKGAKVNFLRRNPKACYSIYGPTQEQPANVRTCHLPFESIILYGNIRISDNEAEKEAAIKEITDQYGTPYQHGFADMIHILVFEINHATLRDGRFKPGSERKLYYYKFK